MNVLDLFSGIGGFSIGLERAGMRTVAFCELLPYPRGVLAKHWPGVPCYGDIRELSADRLRADGVPVPDLICGGFPCQDISTAGKGAGIEGERSGLWSEMSRLIGECRPRWVVAENVPALRSRGGDRVLSELEAFGYACWPLVVGAVHAGAWHQRQRAWVVAYADRSGREGGQGVCPGQPVTPCDRAAASHTHSQCRRIEQCECGGAGSRARHEPGRSGAPSADVGGAGLSASEQRGGDRASRSGPGADMHATAQCGWWATEPDVVRVVHGVPARAHRIAALGNAVVPENAAMIGRAIMAVEAAL